MHVFASPGIAETGVRVYFPAGISSRWHDSSLPRIHWSIVNTDRKVQRFGGAFSLIGECRAHDPYSLILSKTCVYRMIDASHAMLRIVREMSDYRHGHVDEYPSRGTRWWHEQAWYTPSIPL